jgi:hypothetical protein
MKYLIILFSILFLSCNEKPKSKSTNFNEKVVDFAIENSNNKFIELPDLYDSVSKEIVERDEDERLILVQILKKKGFEITNWGRGNHPLGPRIIVLNLKKDNCECEVQKIYYSSDAVASGEIYKTTESIRCKKASR